ncbi:TPA: ead/Ea22-like family protein [Citrobacter freundii]|uniref:ead/Ea22-like family protein n=1 Tax=Citrobacter freundii TaxID=546 RepID=UPI00287CA7C1|nr:ead/Ea22-like family protein [Citrobacter freundii]HCC5981128.1 ead/Ea22-like family protein [Citrobacter freundii]HCC6823400.1 ead/Ea22-like family protein [Citrobacter freundii]HDX3930556.1 ead/Ea22-like family protein [Citrobacter freundii]HEE9983965.1 ead/Ea22-like family protein [Citrobacter freundii]
MTALNKHALREAAEKATPGEWKRMMRNSDELMTTFHGVAIGNVFVELTTGKRDIFDAEFIAAANPSTVLSLLDELEAAEKRIAELEARTVKLPTGTEVNGFHMLIEEEVIARLRESGVTPIVVRAAGISVKGE